MPPRIPSLPQLLKSKIYKTGQTRGADDDEIYQNRVLRSSTVLIPYEAWPQCRPTDTLVYEKGFITLISPEYYFSNSEEEMARRLLAEGLVLGKNALVFYETRVEWDRNPPVARRWTPATSRIPDRNGSLGGNFVARIPATTSIANGARISHGFTGAMKGAGIRVYEYASEDFIQKCRLQLEVLFWLCRDSNDVARAAGMSDEGIAQRRAYNLEQSGQNELLDYPRLTQQRIINGARNTVCPLCLEELSAQGFLNRMEQAPGRAVHDLTITELNLFHINELRYGAYNHCPYNLGWGHHHCNVVVKDAGIQATLQWMLRVIRGNVHADHISVNEDMLHWMRLVIERNTSSA